ncbi:MAG: ACT domain-containing protein [Ignisphaera sp.]|nr:ACT domain-containing protein [Ignisphaera sp.]MCX8167583.1 ACT domain-containing protein [Ignisphaera sp.]MDW8085403.1 ACT domain-containing protein [Ignisphaera sp.]
MSSISQTVYEVVSGDPILQQCISREIVNFTRLARKLKPLVSQVVGRDVPIESIKMALIRYAYKLMDERRTYSKEVLAILAKSSVELRMGISITTIRSRAFHASMPLLVKLAMKSRFIAVMQSITTATVVLDNDTTEEFLKSVDSNDVIYVQRDQAAIVVVSPEAIMYTPGVIAYVSNILAQNSINIIHIESCYTDTIIIVSKDDVQRAFNVLMRYIDAAKRALQVEDRVTRYSQPSY